MDDHLRRTLVQGRCRCPLICLVLIFDGTGFALNLCSLTGQQTSRFHPKNDAILCAAVKPRSVKT